MVSCFGFAVTRDNIIFVCLCMVRFSHLIGLITLNRYILSMLLCTMYVLMGSNRVVFVLLSLYHSSRHVNIT